MRDANNCFPSSNRASVVITSSLYDRRALDTTSALPLLNSLTHLTYLTSTSPRIREILTLDGGLERLLHILRNSSIPRPPPPPPDIYGLSISPAIPASTGLLSADRAIAYRFSLAFQCVSNVGVRGSEQIRTRVVQAGVLDVVAQVLEVWLRSRGLSTEAGSTGMPGQGGSSSGSRRDHTSRRRALAVPDARAPPPPPPSTTVEIIPSVAAPPPSPVAIILPRPILAPLPARTQLQAVTAPSQPSAVPPPTSTSDPVPISSSSSVAVAPRPTAYLSAPGSVPTSGDEEAEMNDGESGTGNEVQDEEDDEMDVDHALSVLQNIAVALSDTETGRLAELASASLQTMAAGGDFDVSMADRARRRIEEIQATRASSSSPSDPTPRAADSRLPVSIPPRNPPSPTRTSSVSTDNSVDSSNAVASSSTSTSNLNPSATSRIRPALSQVSSSGQVSGTSSPGASNVSTPMGTPTETNARERSGTLLGRPAPHLVAARRRNRRGDRATSGNDSGTTGGEDDETVDGDHGGDGDEERAPAQQNETSPSMGIEVGIVEGEDSATDIEAHLDQLEGNVDLQMGAPPGAPGAVTPRTAADATPRQGFLPLDATGGTPGGVGVGATPGAGRGDLPPGPAPTPPTIRTQGGLFPPANLMAAPPAIVALATAQATQRTLRDLSLEGNVMTPSETTYRDDDILLSLQLLAYLSKYPHVRQAFHRPREPFHPNLNLDVQLGDPPLPMRPALSTTPNIFSLVERFTFRPSPTDPTIPQLPEEIVYWAGVIMRNACRKDESRGGIRQCANMTCGKWETLPRQFAKCRRCRKAKYCSKDCQSKAWSEGHRFWCSQRGEGEGSHGDASNPSSVASGTPNPAAAAPPPPLPTDTDGLPQAPPHHHHHHHHPLANALAPPPRAPTDPTLRRQVQAAFANQNLPTRPRGPTPVVEPDIRRRQEFRNPMVPIGRAVTPTAEPMDVDEEPAPPPRPSPLTIPTVIEPRRSSWAWLGSNPDPSTTTNNPSAAGPSNSGPSSTATSSLRRRDSPSPSGRQSPLPSNDPSPTSRSSILAPAGGALARAFNFAVPRLNLGGGGGSGDASPSLSPSTGGASAAVGDERARGERRGFFRGLSGGSNGSGEESRPRRGSSGGDMDI